MSTSPEDRQGEDGKSDEPKVGYGRPPKAHQFRKGESGNPRGRPRKRKGSANDNFGTEAAKRLLLAEAYRPVTIREGDQVLEMPAIQAVFRAMGVSAMKGNRSAQSLLAELVQRVEREDRQLRIELFETSVEFKRDAEKEIEYARHNGLPDPPILPHPDDMIVDLKAGIVHIRGPSTIEEKRDWDQLTGFLSTAQDEINLFANQHRRSRKPEGKAMYLGLWHSQQRLFDTINDQLPERYQRTLKNRSWKEGASRPGEFALDEDGKDRSIRVAMKAFDQRHCRK